MKDFCQAQGIKYYNNKYFLLETLEQIYQKNNLYFINFPLNTLL